MTGSGVQKITIPVEKLFNDCSGQGSIVGKVEMSLGTTLGLPKTMLVSLNGPKLKPWGPDLQSFVNACLEGVHYSEADFSMMRCDADFIIRSSSGVEECRGDELSPTCKTIGKHICIFAWDHVTRKKGSSLAEEYNFFTQQSLPWCLSGLGVDAVV
eukprot:GHVN01015862.1.p1 GENE.GHVN01015862.1~~GHVN01015862.1.p1  ORF type:complete len:156 (+),score=10.27 GHVN01015862.1:1674-2141(+)